MHMATWQAGRAQDAGTLAKKLLLAWSRYPKGSCRERQQSSSGMLLSPAFQVYQDGMHELQEPTW